MAEERKKTEGFIWKVDFVEALDSLDWEFLWASVKRRSFPKAWITWVRRCITTHAFSILVNGHPEKRGGGVDSPAEGSEARMPTRTSTVCSGGRCTSHMYHIRVFTRSTKGPPDT